jgi:hypothetical protein
VGTLSDRRAFPGGRRRFAARGAQILAVLVGRPDHRDCRQYRDIGTLGKKRCKQDAAFRRLDFERCFISFDLTNRFTGIDRIALVLLPSRNLAGLDRLSLARH